MELQQAAVVIDCLKLDEMPDWEYEQIFRLSTLERQEKAYRYRKRRDSERCLAAGLLLQAAWMDTQGKTWMKTGYGKHGKPYAEEKPGFHYNISHAGDWVVLAYSDQEVGVDVEEIFMDEGRKQVAEFSFTSEEQDYIFKVADKKEQAERFSKVWTGKESYLKYLGTGLAKSMKSVVANGALESVLEDAAGQKALINSLFLDKQHCLSVCGRYHGIVLNIVTVDELIRKVSEGEVERTG